ncbi:c-type cytochrome [Simiduia agarivorans]|uniref:Cytochrome c oxidase subunit II n=1 Tax=Simiduia agarivorans (strain DSM 21679 / JCM 13881 / BCRC 17597 / SA1) TaxID=1117647 RepID=K4KKX9_SIMAS|nr:c-type cytochrome [Simiduia agarivorans]AFU98693.1 cytochrome c oxidase subunit II [Simiduia agarivorans SA1 = DSM 21679]
MTFKRLLAISGLALCGLNTHAEPAYQACAVCHGANGEGNPAMHAPALAGQSAGYLARQLQHFRSGVRGSHPQDTYGAQMKPMASTLADDAAVKRVADYLAQLPRHNTAANIEADADAGYKQYNMKCGACHGQKGVGNEALNAPALVGVGDAYLNRQMANFKAGIRGSDPKDKFGRQMKMMAATVSDAELQQILAYLNQQN